MVVLPAMKSHIIYISTGATDVYSREREREGRGRWSRSRRWSSCCLLEFERGRNTFGFEWVLDASIHMSTRHGELSYSYSYVRPVITVSCPTFVTPDGPCSVLMKIFPVLGTKNLSDRYNRKRNLKAISVIFELKTCTNIMQRSINRFLVQRFWRSHVHTIFTSDNQLWWPCASISPVLSCNKSERKLYFFTPFLFLLFCWRNHKESSSILHELGLCRICAPLQTSWGAKVTGFIVLDGPVQIKAYLPYHSWCEPGLQTWNSSNPTLPTTTEFLLPCPSHIYS